MLDFTKHYATRLARLATPQVERNRGTWLLTSAASAPSWPADEWERLDRFLIFGSDRGTHVLRGCVDTDGPRVVRRVVELSALGRVASNGPCLTALAMCATLGNGATRSMALEALPEVARTRRELHTFEQYLESTRGEQPDVTPGIQRGGERGAVALFDAAAPHPRRITAAGCGW
jgi:60 kDa SS-A/Ro ribonucleoprotein